MARCGSCHLENREGATTCRRCGTPLRAQRLSEAAHLPGAGSGPVPGRNRGRLVSVLPSGKDDAVYALGADQLDIGRREGEIRIDDPLLGPRHARLNPTPGGLLVTPLDSRNGVYLRLRSVAELADGDQILLGRQVLRFETVPEHEQRVRPAVEDGVVLFGTPTLPSWGRLRQLTSSGLGRDLYHLSKPEVIVGREHGDLVFTDDEFMSRRHAQLAILQNKPVIHDLGSSNGTYVRLRAPHVLAPGDMVRLGDQLLRFELG